MKRLLLLAAVATLAFAACDDGGGNEGQTVTFLHYNDLHARLLPHPDLEPDAAPGETASRTRVVERGGVARLATLIKGIRSDHPASVLMNIGDTYHGGVEALYTNGNAIVDPVNALGIDVGVPGNWDFAYGPNVTRQRYAPANEPTADPAVERPNFPNLAANITYAAPHPRAGETFLPPTLLRDVGGVKVGFIGLSSDMVPRMHRVLASGFAFLEGEDTYHQLIDRHAAELRAQGAQIVVVMSELGIHKDYRLAQVVETGSVDVFFSAHTHEATFEPLTSASGALVVEAGDDGYLGQMDVRVQDGRVVERSWKLHMVDDSIAEDADVATLVAQARAPFLESNVALDLPLPTAPLRLTQPIDTVVGRANTQLDRHNSLENTFNNMFSDILRREAGTEVAMTPGFRFDAIVPASGDVTIEDVYRLFPVGYTLSVGQVSGTRLRALLEEALTYVYSGDAFAQSGGWLEGFSGLSVKLDLSAPDGQRVEEIVVEGRGVIGDGDLVTIAGCSRPLDDAQTLCSYGGFQNARPLVNAETGKPWPPADLLIAALAEGTLPEPRHSIVDSSGTPLWPQATFIQPLAEAEDE